MDYQKFNTSQEARIPFPKTIHSTHANACYPFRTTSSSSSWQTELKIIHSHFEIIFGWHPNCGSKNFYIEVLNFSLNEMPLCSITLKLNTRTAYAQLISPFGRQKASNSCNKWLEKLCGRISWTFLMFNCHCVVFFPTRRLFELNFHMPSKPKLILFHNISFICFDFARTHRGWCDFHLCRISCVCLLLCVFWGCKSFRS